MYRWIDVAEQTRKLSVADHAGAYGASSLSPLRSAGFAGHYRGIAANDNHMRGRSVVLWIVMVSILLAVGFFAATM
jgi:hypothetical protein